MEVITEIILLLGGLFCFLWYLGFSKLRTKDVYENFPGAPGLPILGNALDFKSTRDIIKTLTKYTKEYGGVVRIYIGPFSKFLLISDYKTIELILSKTEFLKKSYEYSFFYPWLGTGLLTSTGPKWKQHRQILTPAFHFQILQQFIEVFESCGEVLVEKLGKEVEKNSTDIYPYVSLCTLDIICESIMGTCLNAQTDETSEYVKSVRNMCRIVVERALSPIEMYDSLFPCTRNYYTQKASLKILHKQTYDIINSRQKYLEEYGQDDSENDNNTFSKKKKPFLDLLLGARIDGQPLSKEEIREEVDTFLFEGHDTTASAISFTLYCLANHKDIQKKAFEEQQAIFQEEVIENVTPTYADLQKMKYLENVIKETLRLYPSVPFYTRETISEIPINGCYLPEGGTLIIFAFGIHRNPAYFENPETFDPDRFDNIDGKLPYAYIPFSAGPRNCIGQKFAMLEMKSTVSRILRKFKLAPATPEHKLELLAETILKSSSGIKINLELRQYID